MGKFSERIADDVLNTLGNIKGGYLGGWRVAKKISSDFDGGTANAHGDFDGTGMPYSLFTVTGDVEVLYVVGIVNTNLAGATATIEVGVAGNTAKLLAQSIATNLVDGDVWTDTGAEAGIDIVTPTHFVINDGADIIETLGTANVTAGQIDYYCIYRTLEEGASVVSA